MTAFSDELTETKFGEAVFDLFALRLNEYSLTNHVLWAPEYSSAGGADTVQKLIDRKWKVFCEMGEEDLELQTPRRRMLYGVRRTAKNKAEIQNLCKLFVETGSVRVPCQFLMNEISMFSKKDAVWNRRISRSERELMDMTNHFDMISGLESACVGFRHILEDAEMSGAVSRNEEIMRLAKNREREIARQQQEVQGSQA